MPSFTHEGIIELIRRDPAFAATLLRELGHVEVPAFDQARFTEAEQSQLTPVTYHADAVVLFERHTGKRKQVFGTILEVQLTRKARKRYTWPVYATDARARHKCPVVVTVVTVDPDVARWAAKPIHLGGESVFRAFVIGPDNTPQVTSRDEASRDPQRAMLSVMAHGRGEVETAVPIARAAIHAISSLPEEVRLLYLTILEQFLSKAARKVLSMEPQMVKFFSATHRRLHTQGEAKGRVKGIAEGRVKGIAEGKAKGAAEALLRILALRGLAITDRQQRRISACTDAAMLTRWIDGALEATSVAQLLGPTRSATSTTRRSDATARRQRRKVTPGQ